MGRLKLGVVDQVPVRNGGTAEEAIRETLELARITEALGYERYWLAEHHSTNSFACAAPEVLIGGVARATERIRVGAGCVLLSHYSPFRVAEQFRMLEALHPGRIDLGVGRAPGGTHRTVQALRYGRGDIGVDQFPRQVGDLLGWLSDDFDEGHPWRRVRAMPRVGSVPPVWVLGSGGSTAALAAELGLGYSFAQFISGVDGSAAVRRYGERFRPAEPGSDRPRASLAVGVVCAPTREEAEWLGLSLECWRGRVARGIDRGIPTPEQAEREFSEAGIPIEAFSQDPRVVKGDPEQVSRQLEALADAYAVDEIMLVTVTHSWEARKRSYELIAERMLQESAQVH